MWRKLPALAAQLKDQHYNCPKTTNHLNQSTSIYTAKGEKILKMKTPPKSKNNHNLQS